MVWRHLPPASVIQICWIAPEPSMSARVNVSPGWMMTKGETFQPCPRPRAALAAGPSVAMPPLPFSPVKFSGLIERVLALDRRARLPRCIPRPLNSVIPPLSPSAVRSAWARVLELLQHVLLPRIVVALAAGARRLHVVGDRLAPAGAHVRRRHVRRLGVVEGHVPAADRADDHGALIHL